MNSQNGRVLIRWSTLWLAGAVSEGILLLAFFFLSGAGERKSAALAVFGSPFTAVGLYSLALRPWLVLAALVAARGKNAARVWLLLHVGGIRDL